jgi:hypothetical protein
MAERHIRFSNIFPEDSRKHAYTAEEAIDYLRNYDNAQYIFLDHDLANIETDIPNNDGACCNEKCGCGIVKHIIAFPPPLLKKIIIHSMNYDGAHKMMLNLKEAGFYAECISFHLL